MKTDHKTLSLIIIGLLALGCDKTETCVPDPDVQSAALPEFTASTGDDATRTALDGLRVVWLEGDAVAVFAGNDGAVEYSVKKGCEGGTTTTLVSNVANPPKGKPLSANVAYYPFADVVSCAHDGDSYKVRTIIPERQTYSRNSFGGGSMPMIAVTESVSDTRLSFRNVFGVLKIPMRMDNVRVKSIEIKGNAGEKLSGDATVTCSDKGVPSIQFSFDAKETMTLDCGEGIELNSTTAVPFYIPLPPVTFSKGVTVKFVLSTGETVERTADKELVIVRSSILNMPEVEDEEPEEDQYIDLIYDVVTVSEDTYLWDDLTSGYQDSPFVNISLGVTSTNNVKITKIIFDGKEEVLNSYRFPSFHKFDRTGELLVRVYYEGVMEHVGGFRSYRGWLVKYSYECRLKEITLPKTVKSFWLEDLPVLYSVTVEGEETVGGTDKCPNMTKYIGPGASEDGRCLVTKSGQLIDFAPCGLTEYSIPEGITSIGDRAFYDIDYNYDEDMIHLESVSFPSTLKSIGKEAFKACHSLKNISNLDGLEKVEDEAFSDTGLESVSLPDGCEVGSYVFRYCKQLTYASLPKTLTSIPEGIFSGCQSLSTIALPDNYTSIKESAFSDCATLESFVYPSSLTRVEGYAFGGCKALESIVLPSSLSYIGDAAFSRSGIKSVVIPNSVTYLGQGAFSSTPLEEISFEDGCKISRLLESTFAYTNLSTVTIPSSVSCIEQEVFENCKLLTTVSFQENSTMSKFENYENSKYGTFYGCTSLSKIELPATLTDLGFSTFYGCTSLSEIVIPEAVERISQYTFFGSGLTKVTIPDAVNAIDKQAFYECKKLEEIHLGSGLESLHLTSFLGCPSIKKITSSSPAYLSSDDNLFLMSRDGEVMLFATANEVESYTFPETVKGATLKKIGPLLLGFSNSIKTVSLPATLEVIGAKSLCSESGISTIYSKATTPPQLMWTDPVISGSMGGWIVGTSKDPLPSPCTFYVPAESLEAYKTAWNKYGSRTFLPDSGT